MIFATRLLPPVAVLVALLCGSAQATDYEVGTSLICDTRTQVERFVALFSRDTQAAIDAEIGMARNGDNAFEIVRILVVGIDTAAGIRTVRPSAYFSLFGVKEYAV
jgi:hypothetical protein